MPVTCYKIYDNQVGMWVYSYIPLTYCSYMEQAHCWTLAEYNSYCAALNVPPSEPDRFGRPKDRQT